MPAELTDAEVFGNPRSSYDTPVPLNRVSEFQKWVKKYAPPEDAGDYDYGGAFLAGVTPDEGGHWPDTFKKPNHSTFSDESKYAKDAPALAGHWNGETFVPPKKELSDADVFGQANPNREEIRATPSILEDVKAGRYADAALAASRKIAGWTDTVFGSPSDNKAPVAERWNAPSVADLQSSDPYVVAAKRTMPGLQMLSPEMIGQLPFFAVPGVAEGYGIGQLAHAPEQIAHLKEEIQKKGLNLETAGDVFDVASQDAMAFLPLAARTRALTAARRPTTIREALKTEEPTNAETTGTQTETASGERSPELEPGQEGRVRIRDDAQNRLATESGKEAPANQRLVSDQEKLDRIRKALGQEIAVEEPAPNKSLPEDSLPVAPLPSEPSEKVVSDAQPQTLVEVPRPLQSESSIVTGVANRILKEEADAGKIEEIQSGEGLSWEEMVDRGRSLLNKGADPQIIARRFQRNGRISADDFAVVRAERERLAVETAKAEQVTRANPNDTVARDAYNTARATETDWVRNVVQPAKTATSDIFRGMQGEAPVDVSTFAGLRKAVLDMTGRDLKPNELRPLQERATNVQRAVEAEAQGVKKLGDAIEKHLPKVEAGTLDSLRAEMTKMAEELTPCR